MPVRMLKKEDDKKEDKKKKPKGSSKLDIFKSYGKYDGKPVELKTGGLTGGQVKLDKNKDGKISGEDFKMMGKKRGGATRKNPNSPKGQNPVSEYDRKGKLKYTAANQGGMMAKFTRGYGAARTSGMGLQDEKVKPGKVQKAALGAIALGIGLKKLMDKKGKGLPPGLGAAALISKKKKDILGKKEGGISKKPNLGDLGSRFTKADIEKVKQQLNRFKNKSTKGGGADESKRMSDKTKQSIKNVVKRIGRLTPGGSALDAGKRLKEKLKKKIMTPAKKMGGGMMMKQYNKGGSVTASCKLGRNKATKLY